MKRFWVVNVVIKIAFKTLVVMLTTITVIYAALRLFPGDIVTVLYGEQTPPNDVRKLLEAKLGLDKPFYMQLFLYWGRVLRGDWGRSIFFGKPVLEVVFERYLNSLVLAIAVSLSTTLSCVALSYLSFIKNFAKLSTMLTTLSSSMPTTAWGALLMVVAVLFVEYTGIEVRIFGSILMPLITLTIAGVGVFYRLLHSLLEKAFQNQFVETYILAGFPLQIVFLKVLRYVLPDYLTAILYRFGLILAGAMATETLFSYPGMGLLLAQAFASRDYPTIMGWTIAVSLTLTLLNSLADVIRTLMDPRMRGSY